MQQAVREKMAARSNALVGLPLRIECAGLNNYISYNRTRLGTDRVQMLRAVCGWIDIHHFHLALGDSVGSDPSEYMLVYGPAPARNKGTIIARLGVDRNALALRESWLAEYVLRSSIPHGTPVMRIFLAGDRIATREGGFSINILGPAG